jgi:anti-sigma-K factor RskA
MATFDQLSAEQRAIIELVLQRGKRYEELADLLRMPESRVRELARSALVSLSPVTARKVEEDWRGQLADYVLGQQSGPESTATKGHLRRSEAARAWTRSLLDSLDTLYQDGMPSIPDAERAVRERRPRRKEAAAEEVAPGRELSPEATRALRRRRLMAAAAALLVAAAVAVLVWPVGILTDNEDGGGQASTVPQPASRGVPAGIAVIAQRDSQRQVVVQAADLPPNRQREAYEVWLYNSPKDARSLGAQVTDQRGTFQGAGPLPSDFRRFKFIDVSREPIDQNRAHSGVSVLRGQVGKLREPPKNVKKGQAVILGQVVLTPPRGD